MINGSAMIIKASNWRFNKPISINFAHWLIETIRIPRRITLNNSHRSNVVSENSQIEKWEEAESILYCPSVDTFLFGSCEIIDGEPMFV